MSASHPACGKHGQLERSAEGHVPQSQTVFLTLDCFPSKACFERLFSLAGAAIADMPVSPPPLLHGEVHEAGSHQMCKALLLHSLSESTWLLQAAGQNRTHGTPGANNIHFIMRCMENRNKPAATTKLSNNCLPQ